MYKKKLMKICLASALAVSMVSTNVAPVVAADVAVASVDEFLVKVEFKCGEDIIEDKESEDGYYYLKATQNGTDKTLTITASELEKHIPDPEKYELVSQDSVIIGYNETLTVQLQKKTQTVNVNYWCQEENKQVGTEVVSVDADATHVNIDELKSIPEGYELVSAGEVQINDGWIFVDVRRSEEQATTKEINVNYWCQEENKQVGTEVVSVDADATHVNIDELKSIPEGYELVSAGEVQINDGWIFVDVRKIENSSEETGDFFVDVRFMYNGCEYQVVNDCIVNGKKHVSDDATYTMFNYSELEEYVPEGYIMTMSGEVTVYAGQTVDVNIVPENASVSVGDFRVDVKFTYAGAEVDTVKDCIVNGTQTTAGELTYTIFNYSELEEYVPKGYVLTPTGEVTVYDGETLEVNVAPEEANVSVGDFFVKVKFVSDGKDITSEQGYIVNGTQITNSNHTFTLFNYSELSEYVPAGYKMTASGDVTVTDDEVLEINVEAVEPKVSVGDFFIKAKFVCDGEELTPEVDCIVNGTQTDNGQCVYTMFNYSELEDYVPEGYVMTASGDVTVYDGEVLEVNVAPKDASVSVGDFFVNVKFVSDGKEVVPAKDYIVNGTQVDNGKYVYTMFNYSELKEYVPEGYAMTAAGDVTVYDGETLEVNLDKIQKESIINVRFVYHKKVLAGGDYFVDPDGDGIFNWSELSKYVPDGYKMLRWGNESVKAGPFVVQLAKETNTVPGTPGIDGKKNGWYKVGDSDWSYYIDNEKVVSDWVAVEEADPYNGNKVGKVWYHMNSEGLMDRGWIIDETGWKVYLLDSNGRMMHSQWVNAPASEELGRPAGLYKLTDDGAVQMNGWAESVTPGIYWFCNAGTGLFEVDNPASWGSEKLF